MIARTAGTRVLGVMIFCVSVLSCALSASGATPVVYPWSIHGTPPTALPAGHWYIFRPTAPMQGMRPRYFVIEHKPSWATFDAGTGLLMGRPVNANAGTYRDVRITLTDGLRSLPLPAFSITVYPRPQSLSVGLTWVPPTENEDGTSLGDLVGYRIYRGPSPDELQLLAIVANPGLTRYVMDAAPPGKHYFAITAVNAAGAESDFSPLVSETFE
jgi:hypothetical protein